MLIFRVLEEISTRKSLEHNVGKRHISYPLERGSSCGYSHRKTATSDTWRSHPKTILVDTWHLLVHSIFTYFLFCLSNEMGHGCWSWRQRTRGSFSTAKSGRLYRINRPFPTHLLSRLSPPSRPNKKYVLSIPHWNNNTNLQIYIFYQTTNHQVPWFKYHCSPLGRSGTGFTICPITPPCSSYGLTVFNLLAEWMNPMITCISSNSCLRVGMWPRDQIKRHVNCWEKIVVQEMVNRRMTCDSRWFCTPRINCSLVGLGLTFTCASVGFKLSKRQRVSWVESGQETYKIEVPPVSP